MPANRAGETRQPASDVIDILAPLPEAPFDPNYEADCERQADAGVISGEIIVCARRADDSEFRTVTDSQKRYAEETAFINDPQAPEAFGIPNHGPVVASGCFIPPCPPPKAIIIDVKALPEAPPGSDADRIARGLPPLGNRNPVDDGVAQPEAQGEEAAQKAAGPAQLGPVLGPENDYSVIDYNAPDLDSEAAP